MKITLSIIVFALLLVLLSSALRFDQPYIGPVPEVAMTPKPDEGLRAMGATTTSTFAASAQECSSGDCDQPEPSTSHASVNSPEASWSSSGQASVGQGGAAGLASGYEQDVTDTSARALSVNTNAAAAPTESFTEPEASASAASPEASAPADPPAVAGAKNAQLIIFVTPTEAIYFGNTCATLGQQLQGAMQQLLEDAEWLVPEQDVGPPSYEVIFLREGHDTSVFLGPDWVASAGLLAPVGPAQLRRIIDIAMVRSGSGSGPEAVPDYRARIYQYGVPGGSDPGNCPR